MTTNKIDIEFEGEDDEVVYGGYSPQTEIEIAKHQAEARVA